MSQPCPILVINLDRSVDRLSRVTSSLQALNLSFERIRAIDAIEHRATAQETPSSSSSFHKPLTAAERACCMSHGIALRRAAGMDAPAVLILEDDVSLGPGFLGVLEALTSNPQELPDSTSLFGSRLRGRCIRNVFSSHRLMESVCPPISAVAILWTPNGAKKFIPACDRAVRPVDVERKHWWEWGLTHAWISNAPVQLDCKSSVQSTIGMRKSTGLPARMRKIKYHMGFSLASHLHYISFRGISSWLAAQSLVRDHE